MHERNVDPAAPEAQALVVQENEIALKHGLRTFAAAMFAWNAPLTEKWLQLNERLVWGETSSESTMPNADAGAWLRAVQAASPWHRALEPIVDEAAALAEQNAQPSAAAALVARLRQVCEDHALGDPLVYVRWARARQFRWPDEDVARKRAGWEFLADALKTNTTQ